jgi:hypothetical protein
MLSGQYNNPIRIIAFNTAERWSEDVSEDVAFEIRRRCDLQMTDVPSSIQVCRRPWGQPPAIDATTSLAVAFQREKPAAIGVKAPFPGFIEPALASPIEKVPSGSRWIHEIKFDGYRVQIHLQTRPWKYSPVGATTGPTASRRSLATLGKMPWSAGNMKSGCRFSESSRFPRRCKSISTIQCTSPRQNRKTPNMKSSTTVIEAESRSEPRQPSRFEKKKNILPSADQCLHEASAGGSLWDF